MIMHTNYAGAEPESFVVKAVFLSIPLRYLFIEEYILFLAERGESSD